MAFAAGVLLMYLPEEAAFRWVRAGRWVVLGGQGVGCLGDLQEAGAAQGSSLTLDGWDTTLVVVGCSAVLSGCAPHMAFAGTLPSFNGGSTAGGIVLFQMLGITTSIVACKTNT